MVGSALAAHCRAAGDDAFAFERGSLDITNEREIARAFDELAPEALINCAAWTDVDACETDERRAFDVNARAVELLARASRRADVRFVTISTDYVFDGAKEGFYTQRDTPAPQGVYAKSKLAGERLARDEYGRAIIVRTGWIFGAGGKNFLARLPEYARRAAETGGAIKAISDSYGTPTYAPDLAARLRELAFLDLPGVYHVTGGAGASFEEFAREAVRLCGLSDKVKIESVLSESLNRPAPRPRNSRLRCLLSEAVGLPPLPRWHDALARFIKQGA